MTNAQSITLRRGMSLGEVQREISKLPETGDLPVAEIGLDSQQEKILCLRNPSMKDKLSHILTSKSKRDANVDRMILWIEEACKKSGIAPDSEALRDVKIALRNGGREFQSKLGLLAAEEQLKSAVWR